MKRIARVPFQINQRVRWQNLDSDLITCGFYMNEFAGEIYVDCHFDGSDEVYNFPASELVAANEKLNHSTNFYMMPNGEYLACFSGGKNGKNQ